MKKLRRDEKAISVMKDNYVQILNTAGIIFVSKVEHKKSPIDRLIVLCVLIIE